jgi:hypothetical protein
MEELVPEDAVRFFVAGDTAALVRAVEDLYRRPDQADKIADAGLQWITGIRHCRYQNGFADWMLFGTGQAA